MKSGYQKPKNKKPFKHSSGTSNGKKARGNKSEKDVYDSLVETYGADKVTWVSKVSDGDGYDIKYINEYGITKYVEVKMYSGDKFFLSEMNWSLLNSILMIMKSFLYLTIFLKSIMLILMIRNDFI